MALNNVLDGGQPYSEKHLGQLLPSASCSLVSAVNSVQIGNFVSCVYQDESTANWSYKYLGDVAWMV